MNQTLAVWLLIALASVSANLPFLTERVFLVLPCKKSVKPFWVRLLELLVYFGLVLALGFAFEASLGNAFSQGWEFYAIILSLYLVLGYPGFVYRYLFKRHPALRS